MLEGLMPIARKPAKISNYKFVCAMLYIIENGCNYQKICNLAHNLYEI